MTNSLYHLPSSDNGLEGNSHKKPFSKNEKYSINIFISLGRVISFVLWSSGVTDRLPTPFGWYYTLYSQNKEKQVILHAPQEILMKVMRTLPSGRCVKKLLSMLIDMHYDFGEITRSIRKADKL